jgi:hypothetical protein
MAAPVSGQQIHCGGEENARTAPPRVETPGRIFAASIALEGLRPALVHLRRSDEARSYFFCDFTWAM